jgi:replicative DNA helicase
MDIRIPPQNIEAEKAVIGSILIDNESLNKVADILIPESFYEVRHQVVFEYMLILYKDSKPVDVLTLTAILKKQNKLKQIGGSAYLSEIISQVPTSANVVEYANIVKESYIRRKLIGFGAKLDESARKEDKQLEDVLDELETDLMSISISSATRDFYDASTLLELQMQKADEYAKNPGALRGLSTGLKSVDNILGGLHKSDLVILAARPSVGKSAFVFDLARHVAVNEKKSIAVFSLEMPAVQVIERMLAQQIKVNLWNLRMGQMSDEDYRRYSEGAGKLSDSKIFIDDTPGINIMQLRSKSRKLMIEHSLDLMVIDYLQLMQGHSNTDNRAQEIGEISRSLKILARELNIPVIALSQLNRAVENRQDRVPQLSDLRESGSIEQDADLVMFLSRDINPDEPQGEQTESIKVDLHIAKHRNGPIGRVPLMYFGPQTKFSDLDISS